VKTYSELAKSKLIFEEVIKQNNLKSWFHFSI